MIDQWYFEIGDGNTYGPFTMEKLQKWAEKGNLMPTHRVRRADSSEWTIAAYVPGLELTTQAVDQQDADAETTPGQSRKGLGGLVGRGKKGPDGAPVAAKEPPNIVEICNAFLEIAYERNASDIHVDPEENVLLIQLRIGGVLEPLKKMPKELHSPVMNRLKIMAQMDISEKRLPQDGRFTIELGKDKRKIHVRAACLPTTHGERMTLRLLAVETAQLTLNNLGMSDADLHCFAEHASQRQGMIMLSGPTGSGKSTTLYAALRHRLANHPGRIITVEDPVEFDIVGVAQSEIDAGDKLQFATALRNILRSDPDVIMIGEIRDRTSADIAIRAALTGHLVFSSLHTNSAAGVMTRLIDMGLEPFQVAATLKLCIAQRLMRRLCMKCRKARKLSQDEADAIGKPEAVGRPIYDPVGCEACNKRGYKGRIGIFEMLPIDDELERRVVRGSDEGEIEQYAREQNRPSLREDAVGKFLNGQTSLSDLLGLGIA